MASRHVSRPGHVHVGHMTYRVDWLTNDEWMTAGNNEDWGGMSDHIRGMIGMRMLPGLVEATYAETLLHEVMHCVWAVAQVNHFHDKFPDDEREEMTIAMTSPPLLFVLRHNPELVKYLTQADLEQVRRG